MRFTISLPTGKADSAFPNLSQSTKAADAMAAARAAVEREFTALARQSPRLLHLALNEAEALALETGFPELVFPLLAQEKAARVASWYERQNFVRHNGPIQAFAA
jgi:hypothetical protein